MRARSVSASFCAAVVALVLSLPTPERVSAQVIVTQPSGNDGIRIFPTPTTGLPSPASVEVTGLPQFSRPHGVACFDDDTCVTGDLQGDGTNDRSRLIIVKVSTASVVGTLPTANWFT